MRRSYEKPHTYIAIDLKSFYASVECVERGLDPLTNNLVVADESRTDKTICLAVSPALKSFGVPGRPRLFEVVRKVRDINVERLSKAPKHEFTGSSYYAPDLMVNPSLELSYIVAVPRMSLYMKYSTDIVSIYLGYIAPEDMHVYSIDEVFMDVTQYLTLYKTDAHGLAMMMIRDILNKTGITATAGIGTNLYLCKVAMDIVAKHMPADKDGVRIASLNEYSYRNILWDHTPLTDFWRVGHGTERKLADAHILTMGDIARCSVAGNKTYYNEDYLFRKFGINAELLIDHAWGYEPCTIQDIKAYVPENHSLSSGQVLPRPYAWSEARIIVREMADLLVYDLVEKSLLTDRLTLYIGYDRESLKNPDISSRYTGARSLDYYGREVPRHSNGTISFTEKNASTRIITDAAVALYDEIANPLLLIRRINIAVSTYPKQSEFDGIIYEQLNLFTDYAARDRERQAREKEERLQRAVISIQKRYGKNAMLKGVNLLEGAMSIERNRQVGGHKA